jgi:hypothetical protein
MNCSKAVLAILVIPTLLAAQTKADTAVKITWGGFVDGYYAWDFGEPPTLDRSFAGGVPFTTQPSRHNEFNVNLAFIEAKLEGAKVRGRFALQTGTSVQSNYSGEATIGQLSGPSLSRLIQEAVVGTRVTDNVWVDGGIMLSHIGMEGWISRDNPTYTRSLIADYSPYYESGVKVTWSDGGALTAQLDVVNGWQNISENNTGKGVGARLDYAPNPNTVISYFNLFSDEAGNVLRAFNGIGAKFTNGRSSFLTEAHVGSQASSSWYGLVGIARFQVSPQSALVLRGERYDDKNQVIVATGAGNGALRANGASVGLDVTPAPRLLWRSELRGWANDTAIFPDKGNPTKKKNSAFVVSSLALTF